MEIIGDRKFVEIPGNRMHELPPLLVHRHVELDRADKVVGMAERIVESEDMVPPAPFPEEPILLQQRRFDLAINLVEQYKALLLHWRWGNDILEWIRQCETTFELRQELREVLLVLRQEQRIRRPAHAEPGERRQRLIRQQFAAYRRKTIDERAHARRLSATRPQRLAAGVIAADIDGCGGCGHQERRPRTVTVADPGYCDHCNP